MVDQPSASMSTSIIVWIYIYIYMIGTFSWQANEYNDIMNRVGTNSHSNSGILFNSHIFNMLSACCTWDDCKDATGSNGEVFLCRSLGCCCWITPFHFFWWFLYIPSIPLIACPWHSLTVTQFPHHLLFSHSHCLSLWVYAVPNSKSHLYDSLIRSLQDKSQEA